MSVETDLKKALQQNDYTLDLIEADELIAVWRYMRSNRFKRSINFSRVPQEWRYSTPPTDCDDLMPCHVSYRLKASHGVSRVEPAYNPRSCHQSTREWSNRAIPSLTELDAVDFSKRNVAPYVSPILDAHTLSIVLKELGINGRAMAKVIKGRQYIVLSGYAGLRTYLPGTVYSMNNRKIIQMAIGSLGVTKMVKSGARLTIYLTVPLTILECFLLDQATMSSLIGHVAADLSKIGISAIMSVLAGLLMGAAVSSAAAPIFFAIAVGVFAGEALDIIDEQYGLTDKLVATIEEYSQDLVKKAEVLEQKLGRSLQDAEREVLWRAYGFDIKNPLSLRR